MFFSIYQKQEEKRKNNKTKAFKFLIKKMIIQYAGSNMNVFGSTAIRFCCQVNNTKKHKKIYK